MSISKKSNPKAETYLVGFSISPENNQGSKAIYLLGDYNEWSHDGSEMESDGQGGFSKSLELAAGKTYEFRYLTAEGYWFNDEAADAYVSAPFTDSFNFQLDLPTLAKKQAAPKKKAAAKPKKKTAKGGDDLRKVEGIGPKIAGIMQENGIKTFADLAAAELATLEGILRAAGPRFKMHKPASWPKQAALAAAGKWEELKKLQDKLNAGK